MPVVDLFLGDYLLSELGDLLGHGKVREPQDGASLEGYQSQNHSQSEDQLPASPLPPQLLLCWVLSSIDISWLTCAGSPSNLLSGHCFPHKASITVIEVLL